MYLLIYITTNCPYFLWEVIIPLAVKVLKRHIQESPCPSVCPSVCAMVFILRRNMGSFYFTQWLLMTKWCVMILTQGHICGQVKSHWKRMCHDFDWRVCKFNVTGRERANFKSGSYLSYGETLEVFISHKYCLQLENVSRFWPSVLCAS